MAGGVVMLWLSRLIFARPKPSPLDAHFQRLNQVGGWGRSREQGSADGGRDAPITKGVPAGCVLPGRRLTAVRLPAVHACLQERAAAAAEQRRAAAAAAQRKEQGHLLPQGDPEVQRRLAAQQPPRGQ